MFGVILSNVSVKVLVVKLHKLIKVFSVQDVACFFASNLAHVKFIAANFLFT